MLAEFIQLPKEGETVGPYLLRQNISTSILGGFYIATNKTKHENVLVHILPEALLRADSKFVGRYREAAGRLENLARGSAVMPVVDMQQISGNLVVQYPAGGYKSMNEVVLDREQPLSEDRVRELLKATGNSLMETGKLELGHYFMTPDFLFLNEAGDLRIAGVGLFQSINYECFERFVSGAVIPLTTDKSKSFSALEILSPEIRNFKSRDLRSDFYCIGMCAYFMLTGTKPERRWATLSTSRKEVSEGWDLFISRCLEPKPSDRFPNYKAFLHDLNRIDELPSKGFGEQGKSRKRLRRIPLPSRLESFISRRYLRVTRLILLGVAGALAILAGTIFYQIIFSDFDTEVTDEPIRRVIGEEEANLVIRTDPDQAMVSIRGPQSGRFAVRRAPLYLKGRNGLYTVTASAPRRRSVTRQIELEGSTPIQEVFVLRPEFGTVRVNGAVGTEVYAMPEEAVLIHLGTIDSTEGLVINQRLLKGKHQLVGLHEGLMPAIPSPVLVSDRPVEITFQQPPKPTEVQVVSQPAGATVSIDGQVMGITPLTVDGLEAGREIEVVIHKPGYRDTVRKLVLGKGETVQVDTGPLELQIGTLHYTVDLSMKKPPRMWELMLSVDGTARTISESGSFELTAGAHTIVLEHPDFQTLREDVTVEDGKTTEVTLSLEPRPVRLTPVVDTDLQIRFQVDDVDTPLTDQGYLPVPANRPAKVEAIIQDHLSVINRIEGEANQRMEWEIPLMPIPGPEPGQDWNPPYFNLPMTWLPAGSFTMGSPLSEVRRLPNEDNSTKVTLDSGYWIGQNEVTQDLYARIMRQNPSQFKGDSLPVDSVTWEQAHEFCRRLNSFERKAGRVPEGYAYRLPTEAEWEYAARAGTTSPFSFGEAADPSTGNFHGIYNPREVVVGKSAEERYGTMPVGSFEPNPAGLRDVHGNVAEWTYDLYWDRHPGGSVTDPVNLEQGRGRTIRGGSWRDTADRVRTAAREGAPADASRNSIGFRVVLAPEIGDDSP